MTFESVLKEAYRLNEELKAKEVIKKNKSDKEWQQIIKDEKEADKRKNYRKWDDYRDFITELHAEGKSTSLIALELNAIGFEVDRKNVYDFMLREGMIQ